MSSQEIFLGVILGLVVNETCDLSPWAARRLVQWSARMRYTDPQRAETRATELVSLIEERPGKLFKLCTALGFTTIALITQIKQACVNRYFSSENRIHNIIATLVKIKATVKTGFPDAFRLRTIRFLILLLSRRDNVEAEEYWDKVFQKIDIDMSSSIEKYLPEAIRARVRELVDNFPVDNP